MIRFVNENIWVRPCHIRIITVNCVGVLGKGIALEYKQRYPHQLAEYQAKCRTGMLVPGGIVVNENVPGATSHWLVATKDHWKNPSRLEWIENGLLTIRQNLRHRIVPTSNHQPVVSIPALGCGNGGLKFENVSMSILAILRGLPFNIYVFNPPGYEYFNLVDC